MAEPARHLRIVGLDPDTGEIHEVDHACPNCQAMEDILKGAERDIRAWRARYGELSREKDDQARAHELWPKAVELFGEHKKIVGKPRIRWSVERFWQCLPFLSEDGYQMCLVAFEGAKFDPFITKRRNGSAKRHDDWDLVFRDRKRFEEFCNRAPRDVRQQLLGGGSND